MKATPTKSSLWRFVRYWWPPSFAHYQAEQLAKDMWRRSYRDVAPHWQPFDDLPGVISQIDNMHAGVLKDLEEVRAKYHQLLYAVVTKHDGETRHDTAWRYILERENSRYEGLNHKASQKR